MTIVLNKTLDVGYRWEIASLVVAGIMPILGVIFWGWDAYAIMFLLSWEVITTSAVLAWLFDFPERSSIGGLGFVLILSPVGLLMWLVLDKAYENARLLAMIGELTSQTWIAMGLIAIYAGQACRSAMREAQVRGTSVQQNNRILIIWILSVYLPFLVFAGILAGVKTIGVWTLVGVLAAKTAVDIVTLWHKRARQISSQSAGL